MKHKQVLHLEAPFGNNLGGDTLLFHTAGEAGGGLLPGRERDAVLQERLLRWHLVTTGEGHAYLRERPLAQGYKACSLSLHLQIKDLRRQVMRKNTA